LSIDVVHLETFRPNAGDQPSARGRALSVRFPREDSKRRIDYSLARLQGLPRVFRSRSFSWREHRCRIKTGRVPVIPQGGKSNKVRPLVILRRACVTPDTRTRVVHIHRGTWRGERGTSCPGTFLPRAPHVAVLTSGLFIPTRIAFLLGLLLIFVGRSLIGNNRSGGRTLRSDKSDLFLPGG